MQATPVLRLILFVLSIVPAALRADARLEWALTLDRSDELFGGLSAVESDATGTDLLLLSDRGALFKLALVRDSGGAAVGGVWRMRFVAPDGRPMERGKNDTEGLARRADGTMVLSTEAPARILTLQNTGGTEAIDTPPDFASYAENGSLEALAAGPDGSLYTLPERSGRYDQPFPVWRLHDGRWSVAFDIPRTDSFLPVGADFGPDGRLYILFRDVTPLGFRSRVMSMLADGTNRIVELETAMGEHGNLEGLAVWRDGAGAIRLLMVADDNFAVWQRSQLVEYSIRH